MSEEMKLFFLWPRLRHDLMRRVRDQGPNSFHAAIQISQRTEGALMLDEISTLVTITAPSRLTHPAPGNIPTPMGIDVQNVQVNSRRPPPNVTDRRSLPNQDAQGRPKCFYCNMYGHVRRHCRRLLA
ncbi:hypothetical protein L7F22_059903 [Adiantum nelumboides]|nr:hypothetical protein [Adiantum nelumboides]